MPGGPCKRTMLQRDRNNHIGAKEQFPNNHKIQAYVYTDEINKQVLTDSMTQGKD